MIKKRAVLIKLQGELILRTVRLEQEGAGRSEVTQAVCSCRRNLHPVCGVDGNTYNNECLAKCGEIAVDCQGECPCQQLAEKLGSPDQDKPRRSQEQDISLGDWCTVVLTTSF